MSWASLIMYLDADSVDLSRLGEPPHRDVGARGPRESTCEDGQRLAETIIARLARRMPQWDEATRQQFIAAEGALVNGQLSLAASEKNVWAGWRNIGRGVMSDYGRLLADEEFAKIVELTGNL